MHCISPDSPNNRSNTKLSTSPPKVSETSVLILPVIVDQWLSKCLSESRPDNFLNMLLRSRPESFGDGYVAWCLLHHYFSRDVNMTAYRVPRTRNERAEIWSHVDLVLRKHGLPRLPADLVAAVVKRRQSAQVVMLMLLYEALTNLKLPQPVPQYVAAKRNAETRLLRETSATLKRYSSSFEQLLRRKSSSNQNLAFSFAHRGLRPPKTLTEETQHVIPDGEKPEEQLERLLRKRHGSRCSVYHSAEASKLEAVHQTNGFSKNVQRPGQERDRLKNNKVDKSVLPSKAGRTVSPALKKPMLPTGRLQPPFFASADPLRKQPRALLS